MALIEINNQITINTTHIVSFYPDQTLKNDYTTKIDIPYNHLKQLILQANQHNALATYKDNQITIAIASHTPSGYTILKTITLKNQQ